MNIVKIYGGLAGQMMQYAFACFLEAEKKVAVKLDISFFGGQTPNASFRKFELLKWNTSFGLVNDEDYASIFSDVSLVDKLKYKLFRREVKSKAYFREAKPFSFDREVLNQNYKIYDGYWVNSQYISYVEKRLRKEFTPRYPINEENKQVLDQMRYSNSVSVHFRRGDYLLHANHNVLREDYYSKAINYIREHVADSRFFVFSDDIAYVRENYDMLGNAVFIDHNKGEEACWDIFLMSNCRHNIIANSGFSYWGAWLNGHADAKVVAPATWMQSENKIEENLLLPGWHII